MSRLGPTGLRSQFSDGQHLGPSHRLWWATHRHAQRSYLHNVRQFHSEGHSESGQRTKGMWKSGLSTSDEVDFHQQGGVTSLSTWTTWLLTWPHRFDLIFYGRGTRVNWLGFSMGFTWDFVEVVSVPASAFPLTLLALMGFKDPIGGQLQVQTETVQWGVRKLGLQVALWVSECFKLLVDRCVWMLVGREVGFENLMTSFLKWQCCWAACGFNLKYGLKHLDKIWS